MKRFLLFALACSLAAPPAEAFSLFGIGKKGDGEEQEEEKEEEPGEEAKDGKPAGKAQRDLGPLPGMDAGGVDYSKPSKMESETKGEKGEAELGEPDKDDAGAERRPSESETAIGEHPSPSGQMPEEVVISGKDKLAVNKPPLNIEVDQFESIRESLEPDQALLLAESPLAVVWRRTHPEFISNQRVIAPWLTTFSERPGIVFQPRMELEEVLQRKMADKEAKGYQWSLTVADEEGKVFQHYEGSSSPPEELVWTGQNEQGEWMTAGSAYSPVYMFTDPGGTPSTRVGKPMRFKGVVHQERTGLHLTMDSSEVFGRTKSAEKLDREAAKLMRSAADLIKRNHAGVPIRVECYAETKPLAERQCREVEDFLTRELMLLPQDISIDSLRAPYKDQRLEIILQNR